MARPASHLLETPSHAVRLEVSEELRAVPGPEGDMLTAHLELPSGTPLASTDWIADASQVRVVIRPLAPGTRSRAEGLLDRALPTRSEQEPGRPWFVRRTLEGIGVYRLATQDAWTFEGSDGAVVAVHMPGTPIHRTHLASRRYGEHLEVVYHYGREHTDIRAMDAFVLTHLRAHVLSVARTRR
ncbi:hypothetical protein GCM10028796_41820 [Ramlibacter monticola]